jgi:signal transduction histidine kinase
MRLYAQLASANRTLERERDNKLMTVQAALASVEHEIRQPLTGIVSYARAASRFLEKTPPGHDTVRELLGRISAASYHISEMLEGVRALFQKGAQGQQLIDLNEIILDVLRSMDQQFRDHGITTRVELTSELPRLHGYKSQLQEVVSNLLVNAVEAMDTTVDRSRVLGVTTETCGRDMVAVAVEDSGAGISPKDLGSIFKAFVTTKPHGTGLGLAITQRIVERHGGQITASSDGKSGALFQIVLPVGSSMDTDATEA